MEKSFYFFANPYQPRSLEAARSLRDCLTAHDAIIYADPWLAQQGVGQEAPLSALPKGVSAVVAFGGDGTLLRAASEAALQETPLLGVHTGTIGFLMAGDAEKPEETAALLLSKDRPVTAYPVLKALYRGQSYFALNDVSITRGEHPGVIETTVTADGEKVFTAHGDGVVISTPLGSTAYCLSSGGPIIRPDAECLAAVPLSARELLLRPVILPLRSQVVLEAHGRDRRRLQLAIDGQTLLPITEEAQVEICLAENPARLIHQPRQSFFATLRRKQAVWNQEEKE